MDIDEKQQQRIQELKKAKSQMRLGGGEARLEAQRQRGKLNVWERIEYFFDPGTFVEIGSYIKLRNEYFGLEKAKIDLNIGIPLLSVSKIC